MGGVAKGLLHTHEGEPIVSRTRRLVEALGMECVLVGAHPAYRDLGLPLLDDDPGAEGPLAGLLALLEHAKGRVVLAIACDMPSIDVAILRRLLDEAPHAPAVAPRSAYWEPLCARYGPSVLPVARELARRGERSLQRVLDAASAHALVPTREEVAALEDWDVLPAPPARDTKER